MSEKEKTEKKEKDNFDFMRADAVSFGLDYSQMFGRDVKVYFEFNLAFESDERAAREMYLKEVKGDTGKANHAYNVEMVALISKSLPEGFPGLKMPSALPQGEKPKTTADLIRDYFADFSNPMNVRVCADALKKYWEITQPGTLFR